MKRLVLILLMLSLLLGCAHASSSDYDLTFTDRELSGDWEGKKIEDVREDYLCWKSDPEYTPPNGESTLDVLKRVGAALDKIAEENEGKKVLVATHGGCIRLLPAYYENDPSRLFTTPIATNVSLTTVIYENKKGWVETYAFDEYLGDLITKFDN